MVRSSGDDDGVGDYSPSWRYLTWPVVETTAFRRRAVPSRARAALLRAFGAHVGGDVVIGPDVRIRAPWLLSVDGPAWIGEGTHIDGPVVVERDACLAAGARLGAADDRTPIRIGTGVWVGPQARIRPGSHVGDGAVVAERTVVDGDVAAGRTVT